MSRALGEQAAWTGGFAHWLERVDRYMVEATGLRRDDLPDVAYADMYEDGVSPRSAARRAIRNAQSF